MNISPLKVAILLSYICTASASAAIITPALPHISESYQLSHGALEWVISIFLLGYVVGQLVYGPLANRFGSLQALRYGLVLNLVGIVLCLIASHFTSYSFLLAGRLITALGAASGLSCTFMLLNQLLTPERSKHAMAYAMVSFTVGIGLAVVLGGVITQYLTWQDCFWFLLFHGIVMLMLTWLYPAPKFTAKALHPVAIIEQYAQALKSKPLIIYSLAVGLVSAFAYGYSAAAPIYAQTQLHLSPSHYGYWNTINMIGMLSSGFLSAHLIKKYGATKILWMGMGLLLPCLISLIALHSVNGTHVLWFFITTMLLYLFTGFIFPAASFFASNAITDKVNASSMMSFINMGSATAGVIILGYLPFTALMSFIVMLGVFYVLVLVLLTQTLR